MSRANWTNLSPCLRCDYCDFDFETNQLSPPPELLQCTLDT